MDIHNSVMGIHNSVVDIQNSIMEISLLSLSYEYPYFNYE